MGRSRWIMATVLAIACAKGLAAQENWTVLDRRTEDPAARLLYHYLQGEAGRHFDARREAVAALETPEDIRQRQVELKERFLQALGGFPERTPLNGRVIDRQRRDGYDVEKVIYDSRRDHQVTAVLYLPGGEPPFPGVLLPCGHSANGKASEAYQRASILLAKNGIAVLCYDPIGQGERLQVLDSDGSAAVRGSTTEHTLVGVGALLVGKSTATYRIWDGIRSLDYLASRPEIDANRLGCTGNSGGGTLTAYLMALDDRIEAAAPSCYITSLERLFATIGPQDAEQNITGQVAFGMEHADYLTMRAPKPTLMCVATQDFFDIDGAWTSFREAKRIYGVLGHGERIDLFEYNDKHGFSLPRRQAAMRWMRRWLLDEDDAPVETDFPIATDAELLCTESGQVLAEFGGQSVFDINATEARELASSRSRSPADLATVSRLLALPDEVQPAQKSERQVTDEESYVVQKLVYQPDAGIPLPALLCTPRVSGEEVGRTVVYLHEHGKGAGMGAGGAIDALVKQGARVLAVDLRGWGETAPRRQTANRPGHIGVDNKEFFLGLHLNQPLLGQRVYDVLSIVASLVEEDVGEIEVVSEGAAGPIALHVAALEPRIKRTTLHACVISWTNVVHTPLSVNQLCNVVPGVLAHYDLPELAAAVAPRELTMVGTVDAAGEPVSQGVLEQEYAVCIGSYADHKAAQSLHLRAEMGSDND
jgi:cephalosporin-C deacetylase-like acetyl esterase